MEMVATAFCPAHITGFFKVHLLPRHTSRDVGVIKGSTGAGFSLEHGVTTRVVAKKMTTKDSNCKYRINITGAAASNDTNTDLSERVLNEFLKIVKAKNLFLDIEHKTQVPIGYGLGASGAVALSLAYALDEALGTNLGRIKIGHIAHCAEIDCQTGLGDVLASFYGGFEIRTKAGAPGIGTIQKIKTPRLVVIVACLSSVSTSKFINERIHMINGLGGKMVDELIESKDYNHFQDMSLKFAEHAKVVTPKMRTIIKKLHAENIRCGIALFGETVFSLVPKGGIQETRAIKIMQEIHDGITIKTDIDYKGARILCN